MGESPRRNRSQTTGMAAGLASALFLGLAPVFGKFAIQYGMHPMALVGLRTLFATLLLMAVIAVFKREHFYIYPAGLLGCFLAGVLNGLGSLLYYGALGRIDASLGQMIYSLYPLFVAAGMWLDRHRTNRLTLFRLLLTLPALLLLTGSSSKEVDKIGVLMMLGASVLYALHLPINQHVLYDMPAPTVTLYTLIAMSVVVTPAIFLSSPRVSGFAAGPGSEQNTSLFTYIFITPTSGASPFLAWAGLAGLTLTTFLSRLMLFLGVKHLGGLQTSLLGLGEVLVAVSFSHLWLNEQFTTTQWLGAILLLLSLIMVLFDRPPTQPRRGKGGWLSWLHPKVERLKG